MADAKITALTELAAAPDTTDVIPIVDLSAPATTKKITVDNFKKGDIDADHVDEVTAAHGVNIDGVLLKDAYIDQGSTNLPRYVKQTWNPKNTADLGGAYWVVYADADTSIVGNRMWSLWGYPKKTADGTSGGYEDFLSCSFPTYDGNVTYTKLITLNAPTTISAGLILKVDNIAETTATHGVALDGLLIKDSKLATDDSVVTTNITAANVTYPKIDYTTLPYAMLHYSTYGAAGGQVFVKGNTVAAFDTLLTNNQTILTKQASGIIKIADAGFYYVHCAMRKEDVDASGWIRIEHSADNITYYNISEIPLGIHNEAQVLLTSGFIYLAANSYVRVLYATTLNVRIAAVAAADKSNAALSIMRVG